MLEDPHSPETLAARSFDSFGPRHSSRGTALKSLDAALALLGEHAARMDQAEENWHDDCPDCATMIQLARIVKLGESLRVERRRRAVATTEVRP